MGAEYSRLSPQKLGSLLRPVMAGPPLLLLLMLLATMSRSAAQSWWNNELSQRWDPLKMFKGKRYLDLTYGSPAYPDCVCGLASLAPQRAPRQQSRQETSSPATTDTEDGRVVGGVEAVPHSLPWMALLLGENSEIPICGASVISDRYVVSAAHCFDSSITQEDLKVVLGEHDRCQLDRQTTRFSIERVIKHPLYRHQDFFADIMLLRLSMRITFSRTVRPICLPAPGSNFEGAWGLVSGWGTANSSGEVQCALQQAPLPVLRRAQCIASSRYPPGTVHESLLCAGLLGQGGKDSCQGDSGGPLQFLHPRTHRFTLIGVVSNGVGCGLADFPGLYTAVAHFVSWIINTTQDSAYCFR